MLEWLQNPFVAIALAVGAMFFGYFFGLFEGRGQGYKRRQEEEAQTEEKREPEAQVAPAPAASPVLPPDESPLLEVSRANSGGLRLRLEGRRLDADTLNVEQRKRLIAVLTQIRPWLEAPAPAPQPAPPTAVRPAPAPVTRPAPPPVIEEETVAAPTSIVAQIDAILHAQLAGTPLMEKGIRLQESPEGGVIVWVGIQKYQGIEDVPDEQIKAAIRTAIKTWEDKYTPGV
jgi:hypothetical protein